MPALEVRPGEPPKTGHCVFSRSYASRIDLKQAIIDEIAAEFTNRNWISEADGQWLQLCLEEVVVNAMLHGNQGDPDLEIQVSLFQDADRWVLVISDQGSGFNPADLPDMNDPQSLLLEHGRGIRLMCEWLDQLVYYRNGAAATLTRRIVTPGAT